MSRPPVKLVFFCLMLLGIFTVTQEAKLFRFIEDDEVFSSILLSRFPGTLLFTYLFISSFYKQKSTRRFLFLAACFYAGHISLYLIIQSDGYARDYHEVVVDGRYTAYGVAGITFNVFLAPLVLAINMYVFDMFFKKRFLKKQHSRQTD